MFYDTNKASISSEGLLGVIDFTAVNRYLNKASYAAVDGKLVIATGDEVVYLVTYDVTTSSFDLSSFRLKSRDIWGLSVSETDGDTTFRPVSGDFHRYNLYNQGWAIPRNQSLSGFPIKDATEEVFTTLGYYPADADSIWQAMLTMPDGSKSVEAFDLRSYRASLNVVSNAARGYFVIDLLNRGSSRTEAVISNKSQFAEATLNTVSPVEDRTPQGAKVVCEYAGRIFYAGFGSTVNGDQRSPDLSSYIAFSRLIRNSTDFSKCYQEGDPTSREASDVVDTDGGLIRISGASNIRRMIVQGKNLLVIADNGVWVLEGGSDYGFSATNYKVDKISTFGSLNADSVITDGSRTYYWAEDSIYAIYRNELGDLVYESLSEQRIATYYNSILTSNKLTSKGVFDRVDKKLRWIYQDGSWFDADSSTKELVFDLNLNAFYKNTVKNLPGTSIIDLFTGSPFISEAVDGSVLVGSDSVLAGADLVDVPDVRISDNIQTVKYLAGVNQLDTIKLAVGWYNDLSFTDWYDVDEEGVDAKAFLMTGAITAGDSSIHKQTPLLIVHMKRTEDIMSSSFELSRQSSCFIRTMWDFATSSVSNKFSPLFQVYRYRRPFFSPPGAYDNGFEVVTTRNKLRGRGRAFSLYMETEPAKDCQIIGWNLSVNGNSIA
jgi:hypothetical protein